MLNIYLTRHGQSEDNKNGILGGHRDDELTDLGVKQAQNLASVIQEKGISFDKIYCSPLKRAKRTAEIIADALNLPEPEVMDQLIERNFGELSGKNIQDIPILCANNIFSAQGVNYFLSAPGAETFPELIIRASAVLSEIQRRHSEGNILLATHGDFGKMLCAAFFDIGWQDMLLKFAFGNTDLILLSPERTPDDCRVAEFARHNL